MIPNRSPDPGKGIDIMPQTVPAAIECCLRTVSLLKERIAGIEFDLFHPAACAQSFRRRMQRRIIEGIAVELLLCRFGPAGIEIGPSLQPLLLGKEGIVDQPSHPVSYT